MKKKYFIQFINIQLFYTCMMITNKLTNNNLGLITCDHHAHIKNY